MIVAKFGGTSLADPQAFGYVKKIAQSDETRRVIVVSAPGKRYPGDEKVTDLLIRLHRGEDVLSLISSRFLAIADGIGVSTDNYAIEFFFDETKNFDYTVSRGERFTAKLVAAMLGYAFVDAAEVIRFDHRGLLDTERTEAALRDAYGKYGKIVIPGFYGSMPDGTIRLFSRGGSDITGAIVSAALSADLYENWTDVPGVQSADPRIVEDPDPIDALTYEELRELACSGADVMHEEALFPVRFAGIPIRISDTFHPSCNGTIVRRNVNREKAGIIALSGKKNDWFTVLASNVSSLLPKILGTLAEANIPVLGIEKPDGDRLLKIRVPDLLQAFAIRRLHSVYCSQ